MAIVAGRRGTSLSRSYCRYEWTMAG